MHAYRRVSLWFIGPVGGFERKPCSSQESTEAVIPSPGLYEQQVSAYVSADTSETTSLHTASDTSCLWKPTPATASNIVRTWIMYHSHMSTRKPSQTTVFTLIRRILWHWHCSGDYTEHRASKGHQLIPKRNKALYVPIQLSDSNSPISPTWP